MIEVTEAMEDAFIAAAWQPHEQVTASVTAGLQAVLALIDPVPADVWHITDGTGDTWHRNPEDPMVWIDDYGIGMFRTVLQIQKDYGGITWEGKPS